MIQLILYSGRLFLLPAVFVLVTFTGCSKDDAQPGHITKNTTWSGEVTVTGDVFVEQDVTLTIEPGTVITVMADQDDLGMSQLGPADDMTTGDPTGDPNAGGDDYQKNHIGIIINGTIISNGTFENPILFKSSKPDPYYTDWIGIVVNKGEFSFTTVEWCLNGIYASEEFEKLTIDHCHLQHFWAAGSGFHNPKNESVVAYIKHTTIEDCGHEAVDTHDPGNLELAYNLIKDSQVGFNLHDNMHATIHNNILVNTTFPILCVSANDVFITQCTMQASIQDNTRWAYQGWTMPQLQDPAGIFVTNGAGSSVIITNSIVFDSPTGLRNEATEGSLVNGYLNMDNVAIPYAVNSSQGAGCLEVISGFVDKNNGDYHLSPDSPILNAGNPEDGSPQLGAYGGTNAEDNIGWEME